MNHFSGIQIRESLLALTTTPARPHKKRRNQSAHYHARIQKKWTKRFGVRSIPGAYAMKDPWTGAQIIVAHPAVMAKIRSMVPRC
ncbi:hypothetical protein QTI05_22670 [Variovorax sp. J22R193]|uniref:hypothetical protein n=1 Tax=Variovorax fucosicus TaxID=3053517 RepID=UPI0025777D62|nr:hypothetical protein [Variovorax sp. J22R193]MDM0041862.1 hypothetical protein [Variovorax sp. J22R193]